MTTRSKVGYCRSCDREVVIVKRTHRVRNTGGCLAYPFTLGLSVVAFWYDRWVCSTCGKKLTVPWKIKRTGSAPEA